MHRLALLDAPRPLRIEDNPSGLDPSHFVTLSHAGLLSIELGDAEEDYRVVTRQEPHPWTILRLEEDRLSANFQGNPLWPAKALHQHPNLRDYFGLSSSATDRSCLLPTTSTINHKIARLMAQVPEGPPMGFGYRPIELYPRDESGKVPARVYVDTYIDTGMLPMGELHDRDSIHDWSYHFISFLFPTLLEDIRLDLLAIRDHLHAFTGPTDYHWNYYGHRLDANGNTAGTPRQERLDHEDAVYRQMAIALDVATAKVVQVLIMEQTGQLDPAGHELQLCRVYLRGVTHDALQSILWMEDELEQRIDPSRYSAHEIHDEPLRYIHERLDALERGAAVLNRPDQLELRRAAFDRALHGELHQGP